MKKLFVLFLVCSMMICTLHSTIAYNPQEQQSLLSSCTDQQLLAFVEDVGIVIPNGFFRDDTEAANVIRDLIEKTEQDPNICFSYGDVSAAQFANSIKSAVVNYYINNASYLLVSTLDQVEVDSLLYNTVYDWTSSNLTSYNCYAYALGRTNSVDYIGDFYGEGSLGPSDRATMSMSAIANVVKADIEALGCYNVRVTSSRPTSSSISSGETAICVRIQKNAWPYDFHFMKLSGSVWRHKPGTTGILTYNSTPSNSTNWIAEGVAAQSVSSVQKFYRDEYCIYDSDIYYIIYSISHNETAEYTGNNFHSGTTHGFEYTYTCTDCGNTRTTYVSVACSGNPCIDLITGVGREPITE